MNASHGSFPTIPQAAALLLADVLLQYVLVVVLQTWRTTLGLGPSEINALVMLLSHGLVLATVLHLQGGTYREVLHDAPSSAWITLILLVPPVLMLVPLILLVDERILELLTAVFPMSAWEEQWFSDMISGGAASAVAVCLLAPVLEEMLFRGVLLRAFLRQHARGTAIAASALYFGVAHLNIYQFTLTFLLGLLLGWLYERSRSLLPCIALHGAINTVVYLSVRAAQEAPAGTAVGESSSLAYWVGAMLAAALGGTLLLRLLSPRRPRPPSNPNHPC